MLLSRFKFLVSPIVDIYLVLLIISNPDFSYPSISFRDMNFKFSSIWVNTNWSSAKCSVYIYSHIRTFSSPVLNASKSFILNKVEYKQHSCLRPFVTGNGSNSVELFALLFPSTSYIFLQLRYHKLL